MNTLQVIKPELLSLSPEQVHVLIPFAWVFVGAVVVLLMGVAKRFNPKWWVFLLTLVTCGGALYSSLGLIPGFCKDYGENFSGGSVALFNQMMISDTYSTLFHVLFLAAAGLTSLASFRYLDRENLQHPEYYVLLLFSVFGMMLMASSLDLIVLFIALELMSLCIYVLVGFRRADRRSNEGAMKYFILGSVASAILLYGTAFLYGMTGSTGIKSILAFAQLHPDAVTPVFVLGAGLVLLGFLFKVASVPFHMWMPDVYEGAPVPVTGFMTTGLKAAAFATFIRVFYSMGYGKGLPHFLLSQVHNILWVSAVLTMIIGNFIALSQTNLKRMLAYSSIAHTGYLLIGILAAPQSELGLMPTIVYLLAYAIMNLGAFVVLGIISGRGDMGLGLSDLSGLSQRHPLLAFSLSVFLLSMASIPPTAGFAAKYLLFYSAVQAHEIPLVVIAVLCSAVSVYYYLRVLVYMYMREPIGSPSALRVSVWSGFAVTAMVVLTIQVGVLPERIVQAAMKAVASL